MNDLYSTELSNPIRKTPKTLLIYAPQKAGKSTVMAGLTKEFAGEAKILCNEISGYDALESNVYYTLTLKSFMDSLKQLRDDPGPFKYVVIDGLTKLNEWAFTKGTLNYMNTIQGKKWNSVVDVAGNIVKRFNPNSPEWNDVTESGQNGWRWQREVMLDIMDNYILNFPPHVTIILVGHVKDKVTSGEVGSVIDKRQVDLTGKLADLFLGRIDATAVLQRDQNKGYLSFDYNESEFNSGSRYDYLTGRILISQKEEQGIKTFWKQNIFKF